MATIILILIQIITVAVLLICTLLLPVGIPAAFLSSVSAFIWYFASGKTVFEPWHLVLFFSGAIIGEVLEQLMGVLGAKKFGASKTGMVGAMLGGIGGAILGSFVPVPLVGTILGVFVGCFALTFLFEYRLARRDHGESFKAGLGALVGKVVAVSVKYAIAFAILISIIVVFIGHDVSLIGGAK